MNSVDLVGLMSLWKGLPFPEPWIQQVATVLSGAKAHLGSCIEKPFWIFFTRVCLKQLSALTLNTTESPRLAPFSMALCAGFKQVAYICPQQLRHSGTLPSLLTAVGNSR